MVINNNMEKVAVVTANIGGLDKELDPVSQSVPFDFYRFNDKNFPLRHCSMTPRLQARIVKMFSWQMMPRYGIYLWYDSSCQLANPDSVKWFVEQLKGYDLAIFKHPNRNTIKEEADYLKVRLAKKCPYITPRYENELIDEQLAEIFSSDGFVDDKLLASTMMVYRNNHTMQFLMKEWWYHVSRFHSIDQLSLPYAIFKAGCRVNIINEDYQHHPYLKYVRNKN